MLTLCMAQINVSFALSLLYIRTVLIFSSRKNIYIQNNFKLKNNTASNLFVFLFMQKLTVVIQIKCMKTTLRTKYSNCKTHYCASHGNLTDKANRNIQRLEMTLTPSPAPVEQTSFRCNVNHVLRTAGVCV